MRQLGNDRNYRRLEDDPTEHFRIEIVTFLTEMYERNSINEETRKYLLPTQARPAKFYLLPKIHQPGNPGRPIVSSCSAPTEKISQFVDYHLRPHVLSLPSYLKDTTDFLLKLDALGPLPSGALLVTLDVTSLYTNTPHNEGIQACEEVLNTRLTQEPPTGDLVQLIRFILTRNNFCFSGQHFLQVHGTAMGTRMAPSYANIFMGRLENHILTGRTLRPIVWWWFIDDIFAVWTPLGRIPGQREPTPPYQEV